MSEKPRDPVAPGQGGRMMEIDPLEERIRLRAYQLYELSGRQEGRAHEHWVEAEAQIEGRKRAW